MSTPHTNQFGRRPTRGIRPWILIPKVLVVSVFFGSLTAMNAIWFASGFERLSPDDPRRIWTINLLHVLAMRLMVPALIGAIGLGVLLLMQHPRIFLRMRWVQFKLVMLAILIPSAHLFLSSRLSILREAAIKHFPTETASTQFGWGLIASLAAFAAVIVIARLKPRLGQNWAKAHLTSSPSASP